VGDEEAARLLELVETRDSSLICHLEVDVDAHVSWASHGPTTFDADRFASLRIDEGTGAPILQGFEKCPLTVDLTAGWDLETQAWSGIEIDAIQLTPRTLKHRSERMTASEEFE